MQKTEVDHHHLPASGLATLSLIPAGCDDSDLLAVCVKAAPLL